MYAITGASGRLGTLVVDRLIERVGADAIVAAVRSPDKAAALHGKGVVVREADYDRPETLRAAFAGVSKLLLVSGTQVGARAAQHRAVIDAAGEAGVGLIAYTSVLHADASPLGVAPDHLATEAALAASGVPHVVLRNGWYTENRLADLSAVLEQGVVPGSAGDGRVSSATRADYADAAAAALTAEGQAGKVYELAGDEAWTLSDLAAEITRQSGRTVVYRHMSGEDYQALLERAGLPAHLAELLSRSDVFTAQGALYDAGRELSRLIGRPTTPLSKAVADALARQR